jgi:hypothetical protein
VQKVLWDNMLRAKAGVDMGISVRDFGDLAEWTWAAAAVDWRVLGDLRLWTWASEAFNMGGPGCGRPKQPPKA